MAIHWTLGCDANDPQLLAGCWATVLDYIKEPGFDEADNASIVDPDGTGPAIGFLRVPEGKNAKSSMHIDIRVAGAGEFDVPERERLIRAKVPKLLVAGATLVREVIYDGVLGTSSCRIPRATNSASPDPLARNADRPGPEWVDFRGLYRRPDRLTRRALP